MENSVTQESAEPIYPCMVCGNAQHMDFQRGSSVVTEVFCLNIHKLLDEGLPVSCSGFRLRSPTE